MYILIFLFIFLFGTIIGSFLNVIIYRFNTGLSISRGRSKCMTCSHKLKWYELVPIFSYLVQSGKCRKCHSVISKQYFIVELLTGAVFVLIGIHFLQALILSVPLFVFLFSVFAIIFSLLIVISVYDLRHKIIPDRLVYTFDTIAFLLIFVNYITASPLFVFPSLLAFLSGPIYALPFALLWLFSKGKWMGLGDAKLMLGIGWMLGPVFSLSSVFISFWIGGIASIFIILFSSKKVGLKTEVPFAPFLILGALLVFLFNIDIFSWQIFALF